MSSTGRVPLLDENDRFPDRFAPPSVAADAVAAEVARAGSVAAASDATAAKTDAETARDESVAAAVRAEAVPAQVDTAMADLVGTGGEFDTKLNATVGVWQPGKAYQRGERVIAPTGGEFVTREDHTAPAEWDASKVTAPPPVVPSMTVYPRFQSNSFAVLYQHNADVAYRVSQNSAGTIQKSSDRGQTWATRGAIGFPVFNLVSVQGTSTLLAVENTVRNVAGQNPRVSRSTDDGATWATVPAELEYPGLGRKSILSPAPGVVLIGEYGNVGNTKYRIRRSVDDGLTWTTVLASPGTDPTSDPGHFHSIVEDPTNGRLVAFMDRALSEVWQSEDEGATWTRIGVATEQHHPNWVEPMFFEHHIAWGNDNQADGRVFRLRREDFYAGNWDTPEVVAQLNNDRFYDTFPIEREPGDAAPSIWVMVGATEVVNRARVGSFAAEVYIVSAGGALVSGGVALPSPTIRLDTFTAYRAQLPGYPSVPPDFEGQGWINLPGAGIPAAWTTAPYTVGRAPAMPILDGATVGPVDMPINTPLRIAEASGAYREVLLRGGDDAIRLINRVGAAALAEVRLHPTGNISFYRSGVIVLNLTSIGVHLQDRPLYAGANAATPSLQWGSGSPEGVVSATAGSVFLNGGGSVYTKTGTGSTGWGQVGERPPSGSTQNFTAVGSTFNTRDKYAGKQAWDTTLNRPVWATGPLGADVWVFADGGTAHSPS